jgi:hypothetical protein
MQEGLVLMLAIMSGFRIVRIILQRQDGYKLLLKLQNSCWSAQGAIRHMGLLGVPNILMLVTSSTLQMLVLPSGPKSKTTNPHSTAPFSK